ncbi:MAG: CoA transferase [bacterium]|nr:CoA transferase [bacterium]
MAAEGAAPGAGECAGPLAGVRVVDMATVVAGPGAARLFGDFGADVIKVESPSGDSVRRLGWMPPDGDGDSYFWKLAGRNKRAVVLDLKTPEGLEAMFGLIDGADLLVENLRPGKLEALGLGPDVLLARNPRLVILRVTAFGQEGPYAQRPGFATLAEALSGYAAISGEAGGQPLLPPVALTDELTGTLGAFGALAALWEARRSGEGQVVDLSLVEALMHVMGPLPSAFAHLGYEQPRLGAGIPYSVPRGTYRCSDGEWVALSASSDTVANRVLDLMGAGGDERFATFNGRFENRDALEALVAGWIAERPAAEVIRRFEEADAAIAPVYTMADLFADEHFARRGLFTTVEDIVMQAVSPRLSRTPGKVSFAGRPLGADTDEVLAELRAAQARHTGGAASNDGAGAATDLDSAGDGRGSAAPCGAAMDAAAKQREGTDE